MPSLIDLRRRIRSVKNTQQITKAMKMVSAAKLRRAQDRVVAARPYAKLLREMLANVASAAAAASEDEEHPLLAARKESRVQLIVVSGEKGLAGAFNANVVKAGQRFAAEREDAATEYVLVGRKARDFFRKRHAAVAGEHVGVLLKNVAFADARAIAEAASRRFAAAEIDAVYLVYNEFKSVASQAVRLDRVLPVEVPQGQPPIDYIYEQPPARILAALLPGYVESEIYRAMLESAAAEHAARMRAMDAASSNAADMIESLTLYLNRVRQASITKEIIEVVSGAAAAE
jgi:F-type H+-transporting ATPase subunit gamma